MKSTRYLVLALALLLAPCNVAAAISPVSKTWTDPTTGMEFIWVRGGSFEMGCGSWTSDCDDDEKPGHSVSLKGFWLGKYEVTQAQWQKVMGVTPSHFKKGGDYPVETVSWNDVQQFIKALNAKGSAKFRLPSEAQWEYACRSSGKTEKYSGGTDVGRVAWYGGNSNGSTHPVGRKEPNGLGLHDMSGNVWEWVEDLYHGSYSGAPADGNAWVSGGGSERVIRGGGWSYEPRGARCVCRLKSNPVNRISSLGFRLVKDDTTSSEDVRLVLRVREVLQRSPQLVRFTASPLEAGAEEYALHVDLAVPDDDASRANDANLAKADALALRNGDVILVQAGMKKTLLDVQRLTLLRRAPLALERLPGHEKLEGGVLPEAFVAPPSASVIVLLRVPPGHDIASAGNYEQLYDALLAALPEGEYVASHRFESIPTLALKVTEVGLAALLAHPLVASVTPDQPIETAPTR